MLSKEVYVETPYQKKYSVVIAGATGLIGQALVKQLILDQACEKIVILARRESAVKHEKIHYILTDFNRLHQMDDLLDLSIDYAFCCLGTTLKTAGSKSAFEKVDYYYVLEFAKLIQRSNIKHLGVVSSVGADKPRGFYLTTKARMEAALESLKLESLAIYRPSLLTGERAEFRFAEKISEKVMTPLSKIFVGSLAKYKPVQGVQLAKAMLNQAKKNKAGVTVLGSKGIINS